MHAVVFAPPVVAVLVQHKYIEEFVPPLLLSQAHELHQLLVPHAIETLVSNCPQAIYSHLGASLLYENGGNLYVLYPVRLAEVVEQIVYRQQVHCAQGLAETAHAAGVIVVAVNGVDRHGYGDIGVLEVDAPVVCPEELCLLVEHGGVDGLGAAAVAHEQALNRMHGSEGGLVLVEGVARQEHEVHLLFSGGPQHLLEGGHGVVAAHGVPLHEA
mmetsp:Transcript_7133/g.15596  ORF Transcript_7133/g.15596 Transcript_7133/m.15596 type:complete len:214 (+) Transcript_7133:408-1049(+)